MEKSEVIQNVICILRWSETIKFYIFTSENIKYTLYFINIFLYFMTLYIINEIIFTRMFTILVDFFFFFFFLQFLLKIFFMVKRSKM